MGRRRLDRELLTRTGLVPWRTPVRSIDRPRDRSATWHKDLPGARLLRGQGRADRMVAIPGSQPQQAALTHQHPPRACSRRLIQESPGASTPDARRVTRLRPDASVTQADPYPGTGHEIVGNRPVEGSFTDRSRLLHGRPTRGRPVRTPLSLSVLIPWMGGWVGEAGSGAGCPAGAGHPRG